MAKSNEDRARFEEERRRQQQVNAKLERSVVSAFAEWLSEHAKNLVKKWVGDFWSWLKARL